MAIAPTPPISDEPESAFLSITKSVRGLRWIDRLTPDKSALATAISQRHDLPELLGRVLAARGAVLEDIDTWLNPTLRDLLPDPASLRDMETGAARVAEAIRRGEAVAVFGDYDVDGAASSALLARFLRAHGLEARIYIPDRLSEGYGPNVAAMEALAREAKLILTVDCGTLSHEPIAAAVTLGADVVVVDHHQADETLPPAHAVINPNREDDLSGQGHLAGAGVTFLLLVETARQLRAAGQDAGPDLRGLLDLVALATVCDVVPLTGVNRALVAQGLKVMRRRRNPGLTALADAAGLNKPPEPYHLGYLLGPRINAGGRIGDAGLGARLLASDDASEAAEIAARLDTLNAERREMEARALEEAVAAAEAMLEAQPDTAVLLLGSADWHKGLIGLVAARLVERFQRPSFVFAWDDAAGTGTGSGRSLPGVDLGRAVRAAVSNGFALQGGGHEMAAGITIARDGLDSLRAFFDDALGSDAMRARAEAGLKIDGALSPRAATAELIDQIERAGPFGAGNPSPRFVFPSQRLSFVKQVGENHVRCSLRGSDGGSIGAVAFRVVGTPLGDYLLSQPDAPVHIAGRLQRDFWNGRERIEVLIEDAAPAKRP
ncbi:single-stranded-DNA-specific exonuclease RecJ [Dichotomicrobium thermohalophilum]|uniref:Single-stranded-DNA-specific exonuclease RecJ n=1 Tax=Dichotomicrobium thermohalophilum TaxID=933063 RepID=A0A397PG59_9HYPH|nr:single-stranded-DNA-specific exonuclease RecJ [Dichotomicrobium thermohalophilum]RIA47443.1 single-stranded-DNA-specific exonuclease [Dichotomicrobium thermohalophilum]